MTFRTKLLLVSSLSVAGAVALVTGAVSILARRSFERIDEDRRQGLVQQFQRELDAQGKEVEAAVKRVAGAEALLRVAVEANRREPDFGPYVGEARGQAEAQALDFLDIVQQDATIISSAHSPARFAYKNDWLVSPEDWTGTQAFLTRVPQPDGSAVALASIRSVSAGDRRIYVIGGRKLDPSFLASLEVAPGMRALLWLSTGELLDARGPVQDPRKLSALLERVKQTGAEAASVVQWTPNRASSESLVALPLAHRGSLLGALLVGASLREQIWLERPDSVDRGRRRRDRRLVGCAAGLVDHGTRYATGGAGWLPVRARWPAAIWSARVDVLSQDEIGELARAFNRMTEQLLEQRDRAIQAERVAAWRELARRLAHELKNPLFPLQITIENLEAPRERSSLESSTRYSRRAPPRCWRNSQI